MSDKKEGVLDLLFETREENLYTLNEKDKEKIKNLTKNNEKIIWNIRRFI